MEVKMKTKKLSKKLLLKKRTIANLEKNAMGKINGGEVTYTCTCPLSCVQVCMPSAYTYCEPTDVRCHPTHDGICGPEPDTLEVAC